MVRPVTGNKPDDIRQATVDEVAAVGSSAVSVNKIAERAGVAVGTIYRFHATKDDLLAAVYLQVKTDIHDVMMHDAEQFTATSDRLHAMWVALVSYGFRAPSDFLFAEVMGADVRNVKRSGEQLTKLHNEILAEIESGIADGTLAEVSVRSIEVVLASTASSLARRAAFSGTPPEQDELEEVYALIWKSISRPS